jgi:hypothetical protein
MKALCDGLLKYMAAEIENISAQATEAKDARR